MIRLLTGFLLSAVACISAAGQSYVPATTEPDAGSKQSTNVRLDKPEVLRLIALNEAAARIDETTRADQKHLVMVYSNLGALYAEAGLYLKAEDAIRRAIALLADGPKEQEADQIGRLAVLHIAMGQVRQGEKDELHALQIRKDAADPVGIALSESALGGLYDEERKVSKAADYAEPAYDVLANRPEVSLADRIGVRHTLGFALTGLRSCDRGMKVLEDALELAKSSPGVGNMSVGYSEYEMGFGYWHCGDKDHAAIWLERGTTDMRSDYGWGRELYLNAMQQYARFLREAGRNEAAVSAEAVVQQAESVVDVNSLTDRAPVLRSSGFK